MKGSTHFAGGALTGLALGCALYGNAGFAGYLELPVMVGISGFGAMLADADKHNSKIGRKMGGLSVISEVIFHHRGMLHTPFFVLLLALLLRPFAATRLFYDCYISFLVGYVSHILLDCLNKRGIMLLYPISRKHFHFATINTGGFFDYLLQVLMYIGCGVLIAIFIL